MRNTKEYTETTAIKMFFSCQLSASKGLYRFFCNSARSSSSKTRAVHIPWHLHMTPAISFWVYFKSKFKSNTSSRIPQGRSFGVMILVTTSPSQNVVVISGFVVRVVLETPGGFLETPDGRGRLVNSDVELENDDVELTNERYCSGDWRRGI
ncbi:hypothetical protein DPMN_186215 [Dreissena polymorpha]|uniref:Uncharacterized protein n=1 Tax=Dreissena polymorpha TaxID=45954 RepID=A0A9D4I9E3_DREPO|nr:hypothetical protein DPMN_186215 [Dreissena polymorpha]